MASASNLIMASSRRCWASASWRVSIATAATPDSSATKLRNGWPACSCTCPSPSCRINMPTQRLAAVIQHQGQGALMQAEGLAHCRGQVLLGSLVHGQLARVLFAMAGSGQAQQGVFGIEQVNHAGTAPGGLHQMGRTHRRACVPGRARC
ncbi:hypothetical protein PPS11_28793 [Pseudomonas putida S11]|nr:hypothetical protein PPS11_28793 [Pseudomonas putida S11]